MKTPGSGLSRLSGLSLAQRLLVGALVWSAIIVVGGVIAISAVYRAQALSLLEDELDGTLVTLSRALDLLPDGRVVSVDERLPPDPRFETPLSGRYWMIVAVEDNNQRGNDIRSRSLFENDLPLLEELVEKALSSPGTVIRNSSIGPYDEPIRISLQSITIPNRDNPILLVAASDRSATDAGADRLRTILLIAMLLLASGTLLAMWLGLRFALRPLQKIQGDVANVREGRNANLTGDYPREVQPLTEELNKLLEHNRSVVERARTHVGNLAHALKTPLAVLRNEATGNSQLAQTVQRQTEAMRTNVDHYLNRAQAAARAETLGTRSAAEDSINGLVRMMNKLYRDQGRTITSYVESEVFVRIEQQDLDEILGNLVDNACKWAETRVELRAERINHTQILFHVDDDGPGLSSEDRTMVVKRGVRLDETAPGSGLGLSIVADLADMNGGSLSLSDSPLGGLRATVNLRAAT